MYHKKFCIKGLFIILFLSVICNNNINAQVIPDSIKEVKNYKEVLPNSSQTFGFSTIDSYPMYPDGTNGIIELIKNNMKYPKKAKRKKIEGKVILQFTININGEISDIEVIQSVDKILDNEAIRVLKLMDKWEPAYQNGKAVKFVLTQTFVFKL